MKLYHGTTKQNVKEIETTNILNGPVYLTPNFETAEEYAANNSENYRVYEIEIDIEKLNYDSEFVNNPSVSESLEAGSVYTSENVDVSKCEFVDFVEYERIS